MARNPQTIRSERTRVALRKAALSRFQAQGVEATTAEQIAADAGVTLRTFYRHFPSKHDLLFADYDSGLQWFRGALAARPADESVVESVRAAIFAFPYDVQPLTQMAAFRAAELDPERIVNHLRRVENDLAEAITEHLERRTKGSDRALDVVVTARCIAAALFAAMEVWMRQDRRTLADLAEASHATLTALETGLGPDGMFRHS
ncbi:TetR/AcrR family transcriptional regulator [Aeromicrobium terrae]|jgi:AcrR family transcriptional regulator|uniref:TetR family transcriptional regulator n=1 Tax=Aeromicrobium terrae TaxID=2498846 RepID=A0A5C8NQT5_9ACTN|nr:TetR/AcrR family transcriptional regulator [Aeromicrobium terrae]TXL62763.1 TetR family transcriptional regulator [Aeromicrobium terrae]